MYDGNNKTALQSQKLIADAMLRLLDSLSFADISVSSICKEADVSRQTFYTVFGTKENVMIYELTQKCRYTPEQKQCDCRTEKLRELCAEYSGYIIENRRIMELLVRNNMMQCFYDVQYRALMDCEHFVRDVPDRERQFIVDFIAEGISSIAKNYVLTGCTADEAALADIIYMLFSGGYFHGDVYK